MKLIAQVKLTPNPEQAQALRASLEAMNDACNHVSEHAWKTKTFRHYDLHHALYKMVRTKFNLTAQAVVRCLAKVSNAYKLDRKTKRKFSPHGSIAYDDRILRWYIGQSQVSIWTLNGRQRVPFVCGNRQKLLLASRQGESDLALVDGVFYLLATCNVVDPPPKHVKDFLGIDFGIKNIAVDSEGKVFSGGKVNGLRKRHARLRAKLQKKRTKSAKRLLKKRKHRESRFQKDANHCISKALVVKAEGTGRGLALEDLKGIRTRINGSRSRRRDLHGWAFCQLRQFVEYKAKLAGVPVVLINPAYTSQTCPCCGYVSKDNRKTQAKFLCVSCGFSGHADHVAAENIRRAVVNPPNVSGRHKTA